MVKEILQIGHPTLRRIAKKVKLTDINTHVIQNIIGTLITTAKKSNGVGIAAPQIGYSLQIVIIASYPNVRYPDAPLMEPVAMINPQIISHSEAMVLGIEGCLSVKEKRGNVNRYQQVEVEYCDRHGQYHRQIYHGFVARIIQHEIDHLNGILFVDRLEDELSKSEV